MSRPSYSAVARVVAVSSRFSLSESITLAFASSSSSRSPIPNETNVLDGSTSRNGSELSDEARHLAIRDALVPIVMVQTMSPCGERNYDTYTTLLGASYISGPISLSFGPRLTLSTSHHRNTVLFLEAEDSEKPLKLYLNSPGGSVTAGVAIYDTMRYIAPPVHTSCLGQAPSMGSFVLAGGEKGHRYSLKNSNVMIHPFRWCFKSSIQHRIHAKEILRIRSGLTDDHTVHFQKANEDLYNARDRFENALQRDSFTTTQEAVEFGIVDKIVEKRVTSDSTSESEE